jgi:plasmid stability protein
MSQLVVRRLDDEVKRRLKSRAARHGRSMEEEVRDILRDAVNGEALDDLSVGLGTLARRRFAGLDFEGDVIEKLPDAPIEPPKFDE